MLVAPFHAQSGGILQLAADVLARGLAQAAEVVVDRGKPHVDAGRGQPRLTTQAMRLRCGGPECVLRGAGILDRDHAHAVFLRKSFGAHEDGIEQTVLLVRFRAGCETEMADF